MSISGIGMFEGGLVGVRKEAFAGSAFFEAVLDVGGLSVECEAELVRIVEIDGFGAAFFGVELGVVPGTGDGTFFPLGFGIGTSVSSSVVSFGLIEPGGFGFHFLSTRSDDAAVWPELGRFGVVSSKVEGDVSLPVLGIVFVSMDVLIHIVSIESGIGDEALDEQVSLLSVVLRQRECEGHISSVGSLGAFRDTDFDVERSVLFGEDG